MLFKIVLLSSLYTCMCIYRGIEIIGLLSKSRVDMGYCVQCSLLLSICDRPVLVKPDVCSLPFPVVLLSSSSVGNRIHCLFTPMLFFFFFFFLFVFLFLFSEIMCVSFTTSCRLFTDCISKSIIGNCDCRDVASLPTGRQPNVPNIVT